MRAFVDIECESQVMYEADPPHATRKLWKITVAGFDPHYVITSAAHVSIGPYDEGEETFVFPSNSDGDFVSWSELPGSFKGELDHTRAIQGYLRSLDLDTGAYNWELFDDSFYLESEAIA